MVMFLGNRDIQVHKKDKSELKDKFAQYLTLNNDDKDYYIINKSSKENTFLDNSAHYLNHWNELKHVLQFVFLDRSIEIVKDKQRGDEVDITVYIITTNQTNPHPQDCVHVAEMLARKLEGLGMKYEKRLIEFNPGKLGELIKHTNQVYDEIESAEYDHVFVSNSGGTPNMRTASHFAGLFKGYDYITISASSDRNAQTFIKQEKEVLRNTLNKLLTHFNYTGILDLPFKNKRINRLCRYAHYRKFLAFEEARREINGHTKDEFCAILYNDLETIRSNRRLLEKEMYFSAKIVWRNGAFSDYLWRISTLYDNILLKYMDEHFNMDFNIVIKKSYRGQENKWERFLDDHPSIKSYLDSRNRDGKDWDETQGSDKKLWFNKPNKYVYKCIYDFCEIGSQYPEKKELLAQLLEYMEIFGDYRNRVAHYLSGTSKDEVNKNKDMKKGMSIEKFNRLLDQYYNSEENDFGIYDQINDKIKSYF